MASLKELRGRIQSVQSTQQITRAMKMVAAAKLKRAQQQITQLRPYANKLNGLLANVSASLDSSQNNEYKEKRSPEKVLLVLVSSDRGLCGAFNNLLFKHLQRTVQEKYATQYEQGNLQLLCIGKKGRDFFAKRGYNIIEDYVDLFNELHFEKVREAAERVMKDFTDKQFDQVEIFYNQFKNAATFFQINEQFLPIEEPAEEEGSQEATDYLYEPSVSYIIEELIPKSLKIQFYKALLDSNASEQGSRMTAMDKATDNAEELIKELRLTYNRTRQAAITKEILEISAGAEALEQS